MGFHLLVLLFNQKSSPTDVFPIYSSIIASRLYVFIITSFTTPDLISLIKFERVYWPMGWRQFVDQVRIVMQLGKVAVDQRTS